MQDYSCPPWPALDELKGVPTDLVREYYTQRTGAGLILTECVAVSQRGIGYPYKAASTWKSRLKAGGGLSKASNRKEPKCSSKSTTPVESLTLSWTEDSNRSLHLPSTQGKKFLPSWGWLSCPQIGNFGRYPKRKGLSRELILVGQVGDGFTLSNKILLSIG
jgi:hypothetical protein